MEVDDLLDSTELAALLGVTRQSLSSMRARPERHPRIANLPAPFRTVSRVPLWLRSDIERWMEDMSETSHRRTGRSS